MNIFFLKKMLFYGEKKKRDCVIVTFSIHKDYSSFSLVHDQNGNSNFQHFSFFKRGNIVSVRLNENSS